MVDGLGVPADGWENSVYDKYCHEYFYNLLKISSIPVDACLGVNGIPQSATGQTTLFTGINAAKLMGTHLAAFPGVRLKKLISERNILLTVKNMGFRVVFANSYIRYSLENIYKSRYCSVTSAMNYSITNKAFSDIDLINERSVYHDITRESINKKFNIPIVAPESAAAHLLNISNDYDLTLFEYFLTDRVGHKCDEMLLKKILDDFSRFFSYLDLKKKKETILILCSDHGNCEDINSKVHTLNPVPLVILGLENYDKSNINSIKDVYKIVISVFT